jgi:hypothetical protein
MAEMNGRKRAVRIIAVLSVALAAGQVAESMRDPVQNAAPLAEPETASQLDDGLPPLSGITSVAATTTGRATPQCAPSLDLAAAPRAMIDLMLNAPCNKAERVVIRHAGLSFTAVTSPEGTLRLQLPALEPEALVAAYFDGSQIALGKIAVPDATDHIRFAVQMPPSVEFALRAEDAGKGEIGTSRNAYEASQNVLLLGQGVVAQPLRAQVYSYAAADAFAPNVAVDIKINADTCGRTLPAETLLARGGKVTVTKLAVAMPLCGTASDILVLKNLLSDLTLAAPR